MLVRELEEAGPGLGKRGLKSCTGISGLLAAGEEHHGIRREPVPGGALMSHAQEALAQASQDRCWDSGALVLMLRFSEMPSRQPKRLTQASGDTGVWGHCGA